MGGVFLRLDLVVELIETHTPESFLEMQGMGLDAKILGFCPGGRPTQANLKGLLDNGTKAFPTLRRPLAKLLKQGITDA